MSQRETGRDQGAETTGASAEPPLRIPTARCGPATSGNGGWACGSLAERLDGGAGAVRVRLSAPPPLETDLTLTPYTYPDGTEGLRLTDDATLIAEAMPATEELLTVPLPSDGATWDEVFARAERAGESFAGYDEHPFPTCFACGTGRSEGDGLLLRPGPIGDGTLTAWIPHPAFDSGDGAVDLATTWAGLDCPGGWSADLTGRPMVLGTMSGRVWRRPRIGERCVVRGRAELSGRRTVPAWTTLYGTDGEMLGVASQVWVVIRRD